MPSKKGSSRVNAQQVGAGQVSHAETAAARSDSSPVSELLKVYTSETPQRLKLIDAFLLFNLIVGVVQFVYVVIVTAFPFNAFLAGFASCVGQFVLLVNLRMQMASGNSGLFRTSDGKPVSQERAFADFLFASLVLHIFAINFLG